MGSLLYTKEFIEEVNQYPNWHFLVSGGKESTAMALEAHDLISKGIMSPSSVELVHTNTGLAMKSSLETLDKLEKYTGWKRTTLKPNVPSVKEVMLNAFSKLDQVNADKKQGNWDRDNFTCCIILKEKPGRNYCLSFSVSERKNHLFFTGIAPYESNQRALRLAYYRNRNLIVSPNGNYGKTPYTRPFRDVYDSKLVFIILSKFGFEMTQSSGCRICPIVLLFKMYDKDPASYFRSKRFFLRNFRNMKFCGEIPQSLEKFLVES